jgi:hypothetical protein
MVMTMVTRNANNAVVVPMVVSGGVCIWWEFWSLESGGWFCVGAFYRNLASFIVKMFLHLTYFIKKFYKFCTFSAI